MKKNSWHLNFYTVGVIIFSSVSFYQKKATKPKIFFLKKETKPKPVQTDRFGSVFFRFDSVFSGFFLFGFGSIFLVSGL
jgi:hypothetical protein